MIFNRYIIFQRYIFKSISAWLTVAITVERFLVVRFPLKVNRYMTSNNHYEFSYLFVCFIYYERFVISLKVAFISTIKMARVMISSIVITSVLLNLFPLWTLGSYYENNLQYCIVHPEVIIFNYLLEIKLKIRISSIDSF